MAELLELPRISDLEMEVCLFMLKYLLPLPVVRRSYKLRLYTEHTHNENGQDKQLPPEIKDVQFIGSQYEGLSVTVTSVDGGDAIHALSDYDTMPILRHYQAYDRSQGSDIKRNEKEDVHFLEIYEASHPGYCRLKSTLTGQFVGMRFNEDCTGNVDIYHDGIRIGELNVPYTEVIPGFFDEPGEIKKFVHGPAISCTKIGIHPGNITRTGIEIDVVLSIKCQSWPQFALKWFKRLESMSSDWPSRKTIEDVKSIGCYVVAVPHPQSPNPRDEWRYSFAPAEKILARSLTFAQKGSYVIAKLLFKTALKDIDKVSSYCLKTQMFWLCEEKSSPEWTYDKVGYYALEVLTNLAEHLKNGVLRHYIIPENNIISHIPATTLHDASNKLSEVVCNPFPVMEKIRRTTKYFGIILHPPEEVFLPIVSLVNQPNTDETEVDGCFRATKFSVMEHYCSMLKNPIVNNVQEEFSKLKFSLLMDIAEEIGKDPNIKETVDDMIAVIAKELSKYTEDNVKRWHAFVENYLETIDKIKSENVEENFTKTSAGIQKIEAF